LLEYGRSWPVFDDALKALFGETDSLSKYIFDESSRAQKNRVFFMSFSSKYGMVKGGNLPTALIIPINSEMLERR
jgi:hypothetical protein